MRRAFVEVDAVLGAFIDDEADADQPVVTHRLADCFVYHQAEARTIFGGTAKGIGPMIGARREELADEMAAGYGLNTVEPAFLATLRRCGVFTHDTVDVVAIHLARKVAMPRLTNPRRPDRRQPVPAHRIGTAA